MSCGFCCVCYSSTDHVLNCNHIICKECALKHVSAKWQNGSIDVGCPLCRNKLDLKCRLAKNTTIFKYDREIFFTISASGVLEELPKQFCENLFQGQKWLRPRVQACQKACLTHRLYRLVDAEVLPLLVLNSGDKQGLRYP